MPSRFNEAAFGGDFMDSYLKGYQLAAQQAKMKQDMLIQQQNAEMNKMKIEELVMNQRAKRTALEKAEEMNRNIEGLTKPVISEQTATYTPDTFKSGLETDYELPSQTMRVQQPSYAERTFGPEKAALLAAKPDVATFMELLKEAGKETVVPADATLIRNGQVVAIGKPKSKFTPIGMTPSGGTVSQGVDANGNPMFFHSMPGQETVPYNEATHGVTTKVGESNPAPQLIGHTPDWQPVVWNGKNQTVNGVPYTGKVISKSEAPPIPGSGMFGQMQQSEQDTWYETYAKTRQLPPFAYRDAASRSQFTQGYAQWLQRQGITPTEAILGKIETDALGGSLKNQEKIYGMMGGFVKNINKQVDRMGEIQKDIVNRVGLRALDMPLRELKMSVVGSGNENIIGAYTLEISNEIGKLSTGSSASIRELSVEAQKIWAKIHDPNLSFNELKKVLLETKQMANMRKDSSEEEISDTKKRILGIGKPKAESGSSKNDPLGLRK